MVVKSSKILHSITNLCHNNTEHTNVEAVEIRLQPDKVTSVTWQD